MKSSYRDLHVWQKAMDLVDETYETARGFPDCVRVSQMINGLLRHLRQTANG